MMAAVPREGSRPCSTSVRSHSSPDTTSSPPRSSSTSSDWRSPSTTRASRTSGCTTRCCRSAPSCWRSSPRSPRAPRPSGSSCAARALAGTWSSPRPTTTRRAGRRRRRPRHPHRRPVRRARLHQHAAAPGRHRRLVPRDRPARGGEDPMGPWSPAGKDWQQAIRTELVSAITAAEMQCDEPDKVATRWSEIVQIDRADVEGVPTIPLDNATLRFVPIADGRPEGLAGIDLACADPDTVQGQCRQAQAARRRRPRRARRDALLLAVATSPHPADRARCSKRVHSGSRSATQMTAETITTTLPFTAPSPATRPARSRRTPRIEMTDATGQGDTPRAHLDTVLLAEAFSPAAIGAAGLAIGAGGCRRRFRPSPVLALDRSAPPAAQPVPRPVMSFRSRPDLSPPQVQMTLTGTPTTEVFLVTPNFARARPAAASRDSRSSTGEATSPGSCRWPSGSPTSRCRRIRGSPCSRGGRA